MYKFKSKQISLTDFNTPIGMKLNPDNCALPEKIDSKKLQKTE